MLENNSELPKPSSAENRQSDLKNWKHIDFFIFLIFILVTLAQLIPPFFQSIVNINSIFYLPQIVGLFPIIFDIFLIYFFYKMIKLFSSDNLLIKFSAKYFRLRTLQVINSLSIFYFILLVLFTPVYNPLLFLNITNGSYPAFSLISIVSIIMLLTMYMFLKSNSSHIIFFNSLRVYLYFLIVISFSNFYWQITDFFNFSYLIPVICVFITEISLYSFNNANLTNEEFSNLLYKTKPPGWLMVESKEYDSEKDYFEALDKECKNRHQLAIVRKYDAPTYKKAIEVMERDFKSYEEYQKALEIGIYNNREWKKYKRDKLGIVDQEEEQETKKKNLRSLLNKTNKIFIDQLMEYLDIDDSKVLIKWVVNLPDELNIRLEDDTILFKAHLSKEQIEYIIHSLFSLVKIE